MAEPLALPHLLVRGYVDSVDLDRPPGGRGSRQHQRDPRIHGGKLRGDLASALTADDSNRAAAELALDDEALRALGTVLVLEGPSADFPLELDQLDARKRNQTPKWLVLSVQPADGTNPERALVWVADESRTEFLKRFEEYQTALTPKGNPKYARLMANIGSIRSAVLDDLWQSAGSPPATGVRWWELWLRPTEDGLARLQAYATGLGLTMSPRSLALSDRTVVWIQADWATLQSLPFTAVPLAEIRLPEFADSVLDLPQEEQYELAGDVVDRLITATEKAPAVCLLDSGVLRGHALLSGSLASGDTHSVVGDPADRENHGTRMAGLALFGDLQPLLLSVERLELTHRLESVKILPSPGRAAHEPLAYGLVTAEAVSLPEVTAQRPRVFAMAVTTDGDATPGVPTLWSASVDALAAGTAIARDGENLTLLGKPDPSASRLFVVSAGNIRPAPYGANYLDECDLSPAQDPSQAWNVLTVGAFTDRFDMPSDPSFTGWRPVAARGELSPHSRTSVAFPRVWPIRPDICMEGGNVLTDGAAGLTEHHPSFDVTTTDARSDLRLGSLNATSAATAQAARLAVLAMARYPSYWPETIRALLVHGAHWTPAMRSAVDAASSKGAKGSLLRRYGWGVPTEESVLSSSTQAVTLVVQDEFVPFGGSEHKARRFRLHELPWPVEVLQGLGGAPVTMRVTLSYFVEPSPGRRGWRRKFAYASHGLRFDLKSPVETQDQFVARINKVSADEESGLTRPPAQSERWLIGQQRNVGSLHQDAWEGGTGPDLASCGMLAVHPVGGWWKNNRRSDRADLPVRYSLVVSLSTPEQGIDLYTPIATELKVPISLEVSGA